MLASCEVRGPSPCPCPCRRRPSRPWLRSSPRPCRFPRPRPSRRSRPRPQACRRPPPRRPLRRRRPRRRPVRRWLRVPWVVKSVTTTTTTIRPRTPRRRGACRLWPPPSLCSTPCDDHDSFPSPPSPIISVPPPARVPRRLPFLRLQKQLQNDRWALGPHLEPLPRRTRDDELPRRVVIGRRRHEPMADVRPEPRVRGIRG